MLLARTWSRDTASSYDDALMAFLQHTVAAQCTLFVDNVLETLECFLNPPLISFKHGSLRGIIFIKDITLYPQRLSLLNCQ